MSNYQGKGYYISEGKEKYFIEEDRCGFVITVYNPKETFHLTKFELDNFMTKFNLIKESK